MKTVIIGAGPAGLAAAYDLGKRGLESLVLEQDSQVGGLSRTVNHNGFRCDIGGHRFFTKSLEVSRLWREVLPDGFLTRPRRSRIYYRGRFFDYPLRAGNALAGLGPLTSAGVMASFLWGRLFPRRPEATFEDWVSNRFGRQLFSIFFKTYTEKVWGLPCTELSADWAAQRIRNLNLGRAMLDALGLKRGREVASLIDQFEYPRFGPGQMYEAMAQKAARMGAIVRLGQRVRKIHHEAGCIAGLTAGNGSCERIPVENLVSSMPLTELVKSMDPVPPGQVLEAVEGLRYRCIITVNLVVDVPHVLPDTWVYLHAPEVKAGRLQLYKNWSPDMVPDPGLSILGLEYFAWEGDGLWSAGDGSLVETAKADLTSLGLVLPAAVRESFVVRYAKAYPVYDKGYAGRIRLIRDYLEPFKNLVCVGRYGQFRYNNMDHSIMTGLLGVRRLLGEPVDAWSVNEEAQYHEEAATKP